MKLYEITAEILDVLEEEELDLQKLDALRLAFEEKIEACAKAVRMLEAEKKAFEEEAKRMLSKASALERKITALKGYMKHHLEALGLTRVKGKHLTVSLQRSPLRIEVKAMEKVPEGFKQRIVTWKVDKKAIQQYIQETGEIPEGIEVFQGMHLRIR